MSEYQYYEFQAIDRPLTESEVGELRKYSGRATITATRFVNHYEWGNFKGNTSAWMEKYFDAFLYVANWGTHLLQFRLPQRVLDLDTARRYCGGKDASVRAKGDFLILEFDSENEGGGDWEEGDGWLSSLLPIRADLIAGDHRSLYVAWLLCVQNGSLKGGALEPPVPAGLGDLTASLKAFAEFLRLDGDLIRAAADRSPGLDSHMGDGDLAAWIAALPEVEKTDLLIRLVGGSEPHLRAEVLRRFRQSRPAISRGVGEAPRTVDTLLKVAEAYTAERRQREAEQAARERAKREREAAEARERYLTGLSKREAEAWREVDALIATKAPRKCDEAVKLLVDLRDLGAREGRAAEVQARVRTLWEQHAKKPSLIARFREKGLQPGLPAS